MPVSAKFIADFTSFEQAVQRAETKISGFGDGLKKVDSTLAKFGNQFSGQKVIQDATLMAKAVEDVGGAATLTAREQQKVNALVTEAIAKFKALGQEAPAHLKALQKETTAQVSLFDKLKGAIGPVGVAMAGAFSVTAIVGAGKKVLDFAAATSDMAAKLGLSTSAVQKFQLAFEPAGVSIETVGKASAELANRLVSGDKSAIAALEKLGLSASSLKRMSMEQMFITAGDAVGKLQNKAEQIYASKTLFGKGGVELLAGLDGKLAETTKRFEAMGLVINEKTIKAADDFGDQLGLMGKQLLGVAANAIGPLLPALSGLANLFGTLAGWVGKATGFLVDWVQRGLVAAYAAIARFVAGLADAATHIPLLGKHLGFAGDAAEALRKSADRADHYLAELFTTTQDVGQAAVIAAPAMVGLGNATETAGKKAAKAREEYQKWLVNVNQPIFDTLAKADQEMVNRQFELRKLERTSIPGASVIDLNGMMARQLRELETTIIPGFKLGEVVVNALTPPPTLLQSALKNSFAVLPQTLMSALTGGGNVGKAVGGLFGGQMFDSLGKKLIGDGASGLGGFLAGNVGGMLSKTLGGAIGSVIPGIGTLIGSFAGPLIGKIGGLFKGLFGGPSQAELEGRSMAKTFKEQVNAMLSDTQRLEAGGKLWEGSLIGIRDAYLATGRTAEQALTDMDRLWRAEKLGADAVKRVIDDINEAFEEQRADAERLNAAIERYGFTLEELGPTFRNQRLNEQAKELIEDWRVLVGSGIDIAVVNDKMSKAMSEYLNAAIRTGTEVPLAMKPILESLLAQGKLQRDLSANEKQTLEASKTRIGEIERLLREGQSPEDVQKLNIELNRQKSTVEQMSRPYKDLADAGVVFSETMTEGFDRVVLKLQELIDKLQGAGTAISDLPTNTVIDIQARIRTDQVDAYIEELRARTPGLLNGLIDLRHDRLLNDPDAVIPMARGGSGLVTKPTLFLAGEAGPESFAFSGANKAMPGAGSVTFTAGAIVINGANKSGRQLAEEIVDELPQAWRRGRGRLAARTALGVA